MSVFSLNFSRFHTLGGIVIAPLIFVACVTGFLYAFSPTIEQYIYKDAMTASGAPAKPIEEQIAAATTVYPDLPVDAVRTTGNNSDTTRVLFSDDSLGSTSYRHAVFVDPGTLEIKGDMIQYGSSGSLPFRTWLSNGHRSLWLGDPGRAYMEVAASWLAPLAVSGLLMWWDTRKQKSARKLKAGSRRILVKRHKTIGVLLVAGMLFLGASGLTWSLVAGENIGMLREKLDWTTPKIDTTVAYHHGSGGSQGIGAHTDHGAANAHIDHGAGNGAVSTAVVDLSGIDTVEDMARASGLTGDLELRPPSNPGDSWSATEMRQPYRMGTDALAINPDTRAITNTLDFSEWPLAAKLTTWAIQLHMGYLFGIFSQIALALLAVGIMALIVLGYMMWFKRGRGPKPGALPRPFDWSQYSWLVKCGLLTMVVGYCVIAPLFAVSALVLLILDWIFRLFRPSFQQAVSADREPGQKNLMGV